MGFNIYICLKQLVTDVKSSIRNNPVWFIFSKKSTDFSVHQWKNNNNNKNLQNKMGLISKNETFLKTVLIPLDFKLFTGLVA